MAFQNSLEIDDKLIKNFDYYLKYSEKTVRLKNGIFETSMRPGNEEDFKNYHKVRLEDYRFVKLDGIFPAALVILSESFAGSGMFIQFTALVKDNDKVLQTNSIDLGDRIVIKDIEFHAGFKTFRDSELELIVSPNFKIKILRADFVYKNLKIGINTKPDTLIRLIFYFQVTNDTNEKLIAPKIYSPVRKGFTALLGCFYTSWGITT